jgi:hypothetical protein
MKAWDVNVEKQSEKKKKKKRNKVITAFWVFTADVPSCLLCELFQIAPECSTVLSLLSMFLYPSFLHYLLFQMEKQNPGGSK